MTPRRSGLHAVRTDQDRRLDGKSHRRIIPRPIQRRNEPIGGYTHVQRQSLLRCQCDIAAGLQHDPARRDERRGCHATTHAQATAKVKLRKSRSMNSGCKNCSRLCCMESHESTCGSKPPPIFCLAISSMGLAPNAAGGSMHASALKAARTMVPNVNPMWRPVRRWCNDIMSPRGFL